MKKLYIIFWKNNLFVFILMLCSGLSMLYVNFINSLILNSLISFDFSLFIKSIIKLILAFMLFLIFTYFQLKESARTTQKMSNYLRYQIINKFKKMTSKEFKKEKEGNYTSWLNNDINQIEQTGFEPMYELISNLINLTLSLVALLYIHWSLFLMTVIELIIILQFPKLIGTKLNNATMKITKANEDSTAKTTNLLSGFSMFYVFNNIVYLTEELKNEYKKLAQVKNDKSFLMAKVAILGGLGNIIGQISAYALSGFLALIGKISVGTIMTTTSLSSTIFNTVGNLSQYLAAINSVEPLINKINEFSEQDQKIEFSSLKRVEKINKGIELKNVSFSYNDEVNVLNDINYTFELNKKYAVVGNSGTGKSTIMNLIIKNVFPDKGEVKLDNIDITKIDTSSLLGQITYIEQNPYVFNGSIRDNIKLGNEITDDEIIRILNYVDLKEFSKDLNLIITENGDNFSGGQKQRLALARGLVRNSQIILLDESTSSLDDKTAVSIEKFILDMPDKMVIMISHHLNSEIKNKLDGILDLNK